MINEDNVRILHRAIDNAAKCYSDWIKIKYNSDEDITKFNYHMRLCLLLRQLDEALPEIVKLQVVLKELGDEAKVISKEPVPEEAQQ